MRTYYIYHIPGVKIGVSVAPDTRVRQQGYTDYEVLEEHTDIAQVSAREMELQREYGYRVDTAPYSSVANTAATRKYRAKLEHLRNAIEREYMDLHGIKSFDPPDHYTDWSLVFMDICEECKDTGECLRKGMLFNGC